MRLQAPLKAGDGVVFDAGRPGGREEGGRVYGIERKGKDTLITFGRRDIDLRRVRVGDRLWKTNDPELDKKLRQSFAGEKIQYHRPLNLEIHGLVGEKLTAIAKDSQGHVVQIDSEMPLEIAQKKPLTTEFLRKQLGRLGNTPVELGELQNHVQGEVMIPVSELNRIRRELVSQLDELRAQPKRWQLNTTASHRELLPEREEKQPNKPQAITLVRHMNQLEAVLETDIATIYCEFEDPMAYRQAVALTREASHSSEIWVAPPRITKPLENNVLEKVRRCNADGYLVRNYDHLKFFAGDRTIRKVSRQYD